MYGCDKTLRMSQKEDNPKKEDKKLLGDVQDGKPQGNKINVALSQEMAEGVYANLAMISHSNTEFVIDFICLMPGVQKARVKSRVVITPGHARRLLHALEENIQRYESNFGVIKDDQHFPHFPADFGGNVGEA